MGLRNGFLLMSGNMVLLLIEKFLINPFLVRSLEARVFGGFVLARTMTGMLGVAVNSPVTNVVLRNHRRFARERETLIRTGILCGFGLSLVLGIAMTVSTPALCAFFHEPLLRKFIPGLSLYNCLATTSVVALAAFLVQNQVLRFAAFQLLAGIALLAVIPLAAWCGRDGIVYGFLLSAGGTAAVCLAYFRRTVFARPIADRGMAQMLLIEAAPFAGGSLLMQLLSSTDRFLVGHFFGTEAVTQYFLATSIAYVFTFPIEALEGGLLPVLTGGGVRDQAGRDRTRDIRRTTSVIVPVAILLAGLLAGPFLTDLVYGAGVFARGSTYYYIVLAGVAVSGLQSGARSAVVAFGRPSVSLWINLTALGVVLGSGVVLGLTFGMAGIAAATALGLAVRGIAYWSAAQRLGVGEAIATGPALMQEARCD